MSNKNDDWSSDFIEYQADDSTSKLWVNFVVNSPSITGNCSRSSQLFVSYALDLPDWKSLISSTLDLDIKTSMFLAGHCQPSKAVNTRGEDQRWNRVSPE